MNILCISSIFLLILAQSICEIELDFEEDSTELVEDDENTLHIFQGLLSRGLTNKHHCQCKENDCECCYKVGPHSVCSMTKVILLDKNDGNEYALQGTLKINNGSIFTCSLKLREIPKMCYHHNKFGICIDLKYKEVENKKLQICGHIKTRYSTSVLLNADLFCKEFDVRTSMDDHAEQTTEENSKDPKLDEKKLLSLYFGQFAFQ